MFTIISTRFLLPEWNGWKMKRHEREKACGRSEDDGRYIVHWREILDQSRRFAIPPRCFSPFIQEARLDPLFSQPRNYVASWSWRDAVCSVETKFWRGAILTRVHCVGWDGIRYEFVWSWTWAKKRPEISLGGAFLLVASLFRLIIRQARYGWSAILFAVRWSRRRAGGREEKKIRRFHPVLSLSLFSAINVN